MKDVALKCLNPFTAPACKRFRAANGVCSGPVTNLTSILSVLIKIRSHAYTKKRTKRVKDFKVCPFIGRF